ncbi:MAG: hypothetical protein ACYDEI_00265 [Erysipelotrichaceae bacterium]
MVEVGIEFVNGNKNSFKKSSDKTNVLTSTTGIILIDDVEYFIDFDIQDSYNTII